MRPASWRFPHDPAGGAGAGREGPSLAAFYECFEHKERRVFASDDRFIDILIGKISRLDGQAYSHRGMVRADRVMPPG